jgi:O-antigen/teichoic acid export membrane protein
VSANADVRDLRRAVGVNLGGYALKAAHPLLFILLVRAYGAEAFGVFKASESIVLVAARVAILGLDKAMLWWVPRCADGHRRTAGRSSFMLATLSAAFVAVLVATLLAPALAGLIAVPEAETSLRIMALALVPMVWTDLRLHALMGARSMGPQVLVRETAVPLTMVLLGLAIHPLGGDLALSLVVAHVVGAALTLILYKRRLGAEADDSADADVRTLLPPRQLMAYAWPMAAAEVANTVLLRMDIWAVAALGDPRLVGIYGAVQQFGNTIRQVRRSFDPIVVAISSRLALHPDPERLATGFSYATFLVLLTQLPLLVVLMELAPELMALFGDGFATGADAVIVLSAFWVLNGATSLAGVVVTGFGASRLTLLNTLVTMTLQAALLALLVPRFELLGAALAVGLAYSAQSTLQVLEMRHVTRAWNFRPIVLWPVVVAAPLGLLLFGLRAVVDAPTLAERLVAVGLFAIAYAGLAFGLHRRVSRAMAMQSDLRVVA